MTLQYPSKKAKYVFTAHGSKLRRSRTVPHASSTSSAAAPVSAIVVTATLNNIDVLKNVLSFVGEGHYLYVALTSQHFKKTYLEMFQKDHSSHAYNYTYLIASTEEIATFCSNDIKIGTGNDSYERILFSSAVAYGSLPALKYLRSVRCQWRIATCTEAAKNGRLEILQWCRENDCPWNTWTCAAAAESGHLILLQWCRENGCPWDEWTCSFAAFNGHLNVLKWCRENGCPWDKYTCYYAAKYGHLNVLKWCRENGCPWYENSYREAVRCGHSHVAQWCRDNGCHMPE